MATEADIANLALSHLGENATVTNLSPPDGSIHAIHLARFYPMARDAMQQAYPWDFITRRTTTAQLQSESSAWRYAYQYPANALAVFAVLPPNANSDYVATFNESVLPLGMSDAMPAGTVTIPKNYAIETLSNGQKVIYTNVQDAIIRYGIRETDSAKFDPMFVTALGRLLASYVAGPIIKGAAGRTESRNQYQLFRQEFGIAQVNDANATRQQLVHMPVWMGGR